MTKLLSRDQVIMLTEMSNTTLSHYCSINNFPKPIMIGGLVAGWREGDVLLWLRSVQPETWVSNPEKT